MAKKRPKVQVFDHVIYECPQSLQHWAVGCDFGNRASIYELTGDPIKPSWIQWNMGDSKEHFTHVIKLGTVDVSPKRVRDMAEQNVYNKVVIDKPCGQ